MKPRFAVIDIEERDSFEKEYQIPYGYAASFVSFDMEEAINYLEDKYDESEVTMVVEKVDEDGREVVYKR